MKLCTASEAAALVRPVDSLSLALGPGQPTAFLEELSRRDDWTDLTVFGGMLGASFELFRILKCLSEHTFHRSFNKGSPVQNRDHNTHKRFLRHYDTCNSIDMLK